MSRTSWSPVQRWTVALTSVATLMVVLDQLVVVTALAPMRRDLHASLATLEWTVNAFTLSFAVLLTTAAALGDRYGRRRMFVAGLVLFTAASVVCAVAPGAGIIIAGRTVQGAGAALVAPLAMTIMVGRFDGARRGAALGVFVAISGTAGVCGPFVGGAVTYGLDWRWVFWINVPLAVVLVPLVLLRIAESRGDRTGLDGRGVLLSGGGLFGVVWALVRGSDAGWASAEVVLTAVAGLALLAAFVGWERRASRPMLPVAFFARPAFSAGNATAMLLYGSLGSAVFFLSQYLQVTLHYNPLQAGLRFMPWSISALVVPPIAGRLTDRIGSRRVAALGCFLQGAGLLWVVLNVTQDRSWLASVPALVISGCGSTMAMPAVQNAVMGAVPPTSAGIAAGTVNTVRQVGTAVGVATLAAVFAAHGDYTSGSRFAAGFAPALAVAAGMALLGAVVALALPGARRAVPDVRPDRELARVR